jgi:uncharacterized protein YihD (DUF1040 family)
MKIREIKDMTLEEAKKALEEALLHLAQNAVINKRLVHYVEDLDVYISKLRASTKDKTEQGESNDDTKTK